jgi:hypothetical protein
VVLGVGVAPVAALGVWLGLPVLLDCTMRIHICQREHIWLYRELQTGEEGGCARGVSVGAAGVLFSPPGWTRRQFATTRDIQESSRRGMFN